MSANDHMNMEGMGVVDMGMTWTVEESPDADCYAENDAFLQTLAYCMYSHCPTETNSTLQKFWEMNVVGSEANQPLPKESYQQALWSIRFTPNTTVNSTEILKSASLVPEETYALEYGTLSVFARVERSHQTYGYPIALSLARFIPFPTKWKAKFQSYFILPPLIGNRHNVPFFNTFIMPTRGQALFIAYLIIINIILCAVGFESAHPNAWYDSKPREIVTYVSNRAGVLSFANIGLLLLYSGRNNVLLWLTNWSHSTFLLLHRWVAAICVIEACLHSAIYLQIYTAQGKHSSESKRPYWYWGIIATLAMAILLPASALQVRKRCYELFLGWHIFLSLLSLVGCYLHIFYRYAHQWGYENWIYIALGIWAFERVFRILRMARHGVLTAEVSAVDEEYIKVEIPGIVAHGHVYLYFPTLTWRLWENHPFSVMTDIRCKSSKAESPADSLSPSPIEKDDNAQVGVALAEDDSSSGKFSASMVESMYSRPGLLIYIRTQSGLTRHLRRRSRLPVLVESTYHAVSIPGKETTQAANIIAIAGGVGVTAVTPILLKHSGWHKLFWAVRSKSLVNSMVGSLGEDQFKQLNAVIFHEQRMHISLILEEEVAKCTGPELTVVVCGPSSMADEVRVIVAGLMRSDLSVKLTLVEESFSW
ncbi:putative ferric-chelate reductase (Fre2) [Aspergillus tanneri]|uniref:Ferric oxidoreductase domain-containing protein n=1 Tax=Aspergillus tanneri TaxID=1220188 RepID=A0A5M9MR81_9EURO|nr:uncharacterized protein ATNIH1004_006576 [Aspergillus tanneri]KAA8647874.1 hypothetical protein ATNIH1004_006576 [Aspergillus tanneri]